MMQVHVDEPLLECAPEPPPLASVCLHAGPRCAVCVARALIAPLRPHYRRSQGLQRSEQDRRAAARALASLGSSSLLPARTR